MERADDLVDRIEGTLDGELRMLAVYAEEQFEYLYMDDDLEEQYSAPELTDLRRQIIVLGMGKERVTEVTHVGEIRALLYDTDVAVAVQVPLGEYRGVFVSFSSDERDKAFDVVDAVREHVRDQ